MIEKNLRLCYSRNEIISELKAARSLNNKVNIGFVPTMGALHEGHIELVKRASIENELIVVSIFVNPTQFNNPEDLKKYPRTIEKDIELLNAFSNCIVFIPSFEDIYPENDSYAKIELDGLDEIMEGKYRPGHFQGVVHVVHNFFKLIEPTRAYFGKKDFQQLAIIKKMTFAYGFPTNIIACETLREKSGLAQSSRNIRLNEAEKLDSLIIIKTLIFIQENKSFYDQPFALKAEAIRFFNSGSLQLEYLEFIDSNSLEILDLTWREYSTCCIAAYCNGIRLIDNIEL